MQELDTDCAMLERDDKEGKYVCVEFYWTFCKSRNETIPCEKCPYRVVRKENYIG